MNLIRKILCFFVCLLVICPVYAEIQEQTLLLSFDLSPDNDMEHRHIKISLQIGQRDSSLGDAQYQVFQIQNLIRETLQKYCQEFIETRYDCLENMKENGMQFSAFYRKIKGKQYFQHFNIKQKLQIVIPNEGNFGILTDRFQEIECLKIMKVEWVSLSEQRDQQLLDQAKEYAEQLCNQLGYQFHRFFSVNMVMSDQQQKTPQIPTKQPQQQQQQQQQQQIPETQQQIEQQQNQTTYHFQAECLKTNLNSQKNISKNKQK